MWQDLPLPIYRPHHSFSLLFDAWAALLNPWDSHFKSHCTFLTSYILPNSKFLRMVFSGGARNRHKIPVGNETSYYFPRILLHFLSSPHVTKSSSPNTLLGRENWFHPWLCSSPPSNEIKKSLRSRCSGDPKERPCSSIFWLLYFSVCFPNHNTSSSTSYHLLLPTLQCYYFPLISVFWSS